MTPKILMVTGPTLCGALPAAVALAKRFDGEIVASDPRHAVRHFDICTDKPTPEELDGIALHLTDFLEPDEAMDAAGYAARAEPVLADLHSRGKLPIVLGGSSEWLGALCLERPPPVPPDEHLERALRREMEELGPREMHAQLAEIDPDEAHRIGRNDRRGVLRALYVNLKTGSAPSALRRAQVGRPRFDEWRVFIDAGHAEIHERADARFDLRMTRGWLEEAARLLDAYPDWTVFQRLTFGALIRYLRPSGARMTLEELREATTHEDCRRAMGQYRAFKHAPGLVVRTSSAALIRGDEDEAIAEWRESST